MKKIEEKALAHVLAVLDGIKARYRVVDDEGTVYTNMPVETDTNAPPKRIPRSHMYAHLLSPLKVGEVATVPYTGEVTPSHLQSLACAFMVQKFGKGSAMSSRNDDGSVDIMRIK